MLWKSPRRLALVTGLVLATLLVAYTVWWWQAARLIERGFAAWVEDWQGSGATITHSGLSVEGYPFALRARLDTPHLATRGMEWKGDSLLAEAPPWDYRRVRLTLPGSQKLYLVSAGKPPVDLVARAGGQGWATLSLSGQPLELDLAFLDLSARLDLYNSPQASPEVTIERLHVTAARPAAVVAEQPVSGDETGRKPDDAGLALDLTAEGVTLPDGVLPGLGRAVQTANLSVRLIGDPPRADPASLSVWSRNGGIVELERLSVDWGPAALAMTGTLALDHDLQPQAAFSAELRGADAVLDAVRGTMKPREFAVARGMIGMLSRPAEPDGSMVLSAPLTVQDRGLFVGPLKVASVPLVRW